METLLKTAQYWKAAGIAVIPLRIKSKLPALKAWEEYQKRLPTDTELAAWFPGQQGNIGLVVGWRNLVVIDFDNIGEYLRWRVWATRMGGMTSRIMQMTYQVRTARGMHVYLRTSEREINRKLPGIDIKAQGGYVLIPPSIHPTGVPYTVYTAGAPMMIEALSEVLPAALLISNAPSNTEYQAVQPIAPDDGDIWDKIMRGPDPSRDLIEQVRTRYRVESFFPAAEFSSADHRYMLTCCPFHDDKSPSFWVDTKLQICGCYSGCTTKPLDSINLYARLHGLTNRDAILYLGLHL